VGPRSDRPRSLNTNWGNVVEDNSFGTHEFMALCRLIGAEPCLAGNVGSATPQEMGDWVEYCKLRGGTSLSDLRIKNGAKEPFRVKYWGRGKRELGPRRQHARALLRRTLPPLFNLHA
jgi:alpha-N-arabinofuranosidase